MHKLLYVNPTRMPSEKANSLQIAHNCEAFAASGWYTELWVARRWNPAMQRVDVHRYYGTERSFRVRHLPTIDVLPLTRGRPGVERIGAELVRVSFALVMLCRVVFVRAHLYYTRDPLVAVLLSLVKRRASVAYEAHQLAATRAGIALQQCAVSRAGSTFAISERLADDLVAGGADRSSIFLARDGVRQQRFASAPDRDAARCEVGWPADAFVVGYVGRLQTLGQDKGLRTLVHAVGRLPGASLAIVGGPDDMAEDLRREWLALGLDSRRFIYAGQVAPHRVPSYLAAFDVCAMTHPDSTYFRLHMSPLKLFEYMASHRPIVASDLPAVSEIVEHERTALLFATGDVDALTAALDRLRRDEHLRERLAANAFAEVMREHTWEKRVERILDHVQRTTAAEPGYRLGSIEA